MTTTQPSVLVLGGASDIGMAIAHSFAQRGWTVILAVRNLEAGMRNAADLAVRHRTSTRAVRFDVLDRHQHEALLEELKDPPDAVVCVIGMLGDHSRAQVDAEHAALVMQTNYEAPALFLGLVGTRMKARKSGFIVGVSSVAGERGRRSNYIYGSAKAGLSAFLSGLRADLREYGVRVITVKPGFVATQMTAGLALPKFLTAQPEEVAIAVQRAISRGPAVIYVRPVWRLIMTIIRFLPEPIFSRMKA